MKKICECGRPIVVFIKGKGFTSPRDNDHDLCRQCYESFTDSQRN